MVTTKITSHRGLSDKYPENTMSAFAGAIQAGSQRIEIDIHESKDGVLFIHHDAFLGHPDNGKGLLLEADSSYIETLTISETEHIPSLQELFSKFGDSLEYEIELKGGFNIDFINKVITLCKKYHVFEKAEFTSSNIPLLIKLKSLYPRAVTGLFVDPFPDWMNAKFIETIILSQLDLGSFTIAHCPLEMLTTELVAKLHINGYKVAADCDTDDELRKALELKIDQLSTFHTQRALEIFK